MLTDRNKISLNEISKHPKDSRIMELGSFLGKNLFDMQLAGYNYCGGVDLVRPKYDVNFIIHDLERGIPKLSLEFDIIVMLDTIEHLHNAYSIIKEIYGKLKEEGTLIISIPNHLKISNRVKVIRGKSIQSLPPNPVITHYWFWTAKQFKEFLEENGFKVIRTHTYLGHKAKILSGVHRFMPKLLSSGFVFVATKII